jgi:natural product biosynthesis luciferase-like monooxygenase protein/amino acid adenylation domain-containing protein
MAQEHRALDRRTIVDVVRERACRQPDHQVLTFLLDGETEAGGLTFAGLDRQASLLGAALLAHAESGDRVLLLLPSGPELVTAFFGCLYAGLIAVPAYPPRPRKPEPRLRAVAADAAPRIVLTSAALLPRARQALDGAPGLERAVWLAVEELSGQGGGPLEAAPDGDGIAFLQYTSGSTSSPKGVMVSHANLLDNERLIQQAFGQSEESVVVGWLPLYHDMGLIGTMLQPVYSGGHGILMSPGAFLQQPVRWLRAVSRYRATTSGAPNFAYDLCARKVSREQAEGLDLSCWSVAFNGAEPVRGETLDRFAAAFAPCGFRREAFLSCYGLAEATLFVAGRRRGEPVSDRLFAAAALEAHEARLAAGVEGARRLVGSGAAGDGQRLAVVDPESGAALAPGRVGEIWIAGPSVAAGYWNRPEETVEAFGATLAGEGPYLRTGDLGFVDGGELFVTGRLKDLVIIRGRNHYPQDVELSVERVDPALIPGGGAAFSCEREGEERLVVVQEVDRRPGSSFESLAGRVRQAVAEEHEIEVHRLVLVRAGSIPKTTSGKIQRRACREAWLAGRLAVVWESGPGEETAAGEPREAAAGFDVASLLARSPEERRAALLAGLRELAAQVLRLPAGRVGPGQRLAQLGLDSLGAVELQHALESRIGVPVSPGDLLEDLSLDDLAAVLLGRLAAGAAPREPLPSGSGDELPLSHGQEALWFLHRLAPESGAYHIAAAARVRPALDAAALRRALAALAGRHPALRATFEAPAGEPRQRIQSRLDPGFSVVEAGPGRELDDRLLQEALAPFDLEAGPLLRLLLVRRGPGEDQVVLAAHHIVTDFQSLGVLIRELAALYAGETGGPEPALPPVADYGACVLWQRRRAAGPASEALWEHWRERLAGAPPVLDLPTDRPRPPVQTFAGGAEVLALSAETSAGLAGLARSEGATLFMVLLAAFQTLLHRLSGQPDLLVGSPVADRGRPELAGVVGYFVDPLVLRADLSGDPAFAELLGRVRRTVLDAFSHQGFPFPLLAERLQPERDPSRSPLFQAMLTLHASREEERGLAAFALGVEGARMDLGSLALESLRLPERWAQLDLNLRMGEVEGALAAWLQYSSDLFDAATARRLLGQLATLAAGAVADPGRALSALPLLAPAERRQILEEWNDTHVRVPGPELIHRMFEAQADRAPGAVAVVFGGESLDYAEVERRANRLAHHLLAKGLGPEGRAGVCLERSADMVVALLAILKAGGAYVPLDPAYPRERLGFIAADAGIEVLVTQERHAGGFGLPRERTVLLDTDAPAVAARSGSRPAVPGRAGSPAYLIYTSGSTGAPKGVVVTHGNVASFFAGMDERLGTTPGCWLAVTSISFDISVLELLWTLSRGWKVVVRRDLQAAAAPRRAPELSLFYFASEEGAAARDQYRLLLEGAKLADRHGFAAVWTPERHFHAFGGLYPNPSVTGAAVAAVTERVGIRAGSVVLPLHHPIRVAEEWSVVDNLSGGRVGISFASGWHAADFVFAPDAYATRREALREQIETVRRLWRGESLRVRGGAGEVEVRVLPRPVQPELPVWLTAAGNPETFRLAGEMGAGVLSHLLGQTLEDLTERIGIYRRAWREAGHGPGEGQVALMLHTFLAEDAGRVLETVRGPFSSYLATSFDLMKALAPGQDLRALTEEERRVLVGRAFDRYFESSGLFGTPDACLRKVERLREIGVDEVACLIDFGVAFDDVMASLELLARVQEQCRARAAEPAEETLPRQIARHGVSHLQCTPSAAAAILLDPEAEDALRRLDRLLLGGEPLPPVLAERLNGLLAGELLNMYGPTETTIWSSTDRVAGAVTLGRPIANTSLYLLDEALEPVPVGRPGEVFIGGEGVARGYWERPALTAERFLPDAFGPLPGGRIYRTGDLARWRADGRVAFLGRADFQVKVRGHRIELGEIEAVLARHPAVREAAVQALEARPGDVRLVAYAALGEETSGEELLGFLRSRLPEPMVPSAAVLLEALPRTPNGKVDRRALPAPELGEIRPGGYVAPRTPAEELLAGIFAELLRRERVGLADHFFELGGHSLLAMQLAARVREAFGVELPLRALFETPAVGALAARIEQARLGEDRPAPPPLVPAPRGGVLPLSFAQERLWFLAQLDRGSAAYNMPSALRLRGALDPAVLAAALHEVGQRHEALRTTFEADAGRPFQVIAPVARLPLEVADLTALPPSRREEEALRMAAEEAVRPFALDRGSLLRSRLLHLGEGEHVLLLTMHHIVSDGWSMDVLARELSAACAALAREERPALPGLPVQYADFAVWQRRWLEGGELERQLGYWRRCLEGAPAALELPTDRPRPPVQTFRGARRGLRLAPGLSAAVAALGRREGATLFMTLVAASAVLLSRWARQPDVVLGTPIAGRAWREIEGLIGLVANTLALRVQAPGESGFRALLSGVRQAALAAYAHQDLPFETLVDALQIPRSLDRSPLFQVLVGLWNAPPSGLDLPGVSVERIELDSETAKLDLTLRLEAHGPGIGVQAEYAIDLFDAVTVERLLARFEVLLAGAVAAPELRLEDLPLLDAGERHQLLVEWNDTARPVTLACLHELFARQAARAPEALAVEAGGERLTWRQLAARSGRLARELRRQGVGVESRVGLFLPRSADQIAAILGVLQAGGAYVPLDPASPRERLRTILDDAGISVVLAAEDLRDRLPAEGLTVLLAGEIAEAREEALDLPPPVPVDPGNLAYILYTSGSTGTPKGVMIEHRSVVNLAAALRETVYREAGEALRVAVNAPLVFDASVKQWVQLLDGHSLHVVPEEVRPDADRMLRLLRDQGVQVLDCTPSQLSYLLAAGLLRQPGSLERVLVGGEELPHADWSLLAGGGGPAFFNVYGPTECTVDAAVAAVGPGRPVVGRAIANVRVHLLDAALHPVPPGTPGELCIAGAGVARGYLRRPAQTAERFVPDPWAAAPGERLYRTGDLARRLANGTLEILGRIDRQVKVHGFRIELGEIEAALGEHPGVLSAAVLVCGDELGQRRLVAFAAGCEGQAPGAADLRAHLERKLPAYMVPSVLKVLPELPRTANGKIDRAALLALNGPAAQERPGEAAPASPLERVLAGMVAEVLGLKRMGLHDNFFELGGHSMRAVELVASLRDAFGIELPLFHIFDAPTVAGLAAVLLESPEWRPTVEELSPALLQLIEPPAEPAAFLIHGEER